MSVPSQRWSKTNLVLAAQRPLLFGCLVDDFSSAMNCLLILLQDWDHSCTGLGLGPQLRGKQRSSKAWAYAAVQEARSSDAVTVSVKCQLKST